MHYQCGTLSCVQTRPKGSLSKKAEKSNVASYRERTFFYVLTNRSVPLQPKVCEAFP